LFPFYDPPFTDGGKGWILELSMSSPIVRQAIIHQSSRFASVMQHCDKGDYGPVPTQVGGAFEKLKQALQVILGSDIGQHLRGATRIMMAIMQIRRAGIITVSHADCREYLIHALDILTQLLECFRDAKEHGYASAFDAILHALGPPLQLLPTTSTTVPSAEQSAFRFSSALVIFDDIIASTITGKKPALRDYHNALLDDIDPPLNLQPIVGCPSWVLFQIGGVAVLDAWKQQCKQEGDLDVMELVRRASVIQSALECRLLQREMNPPPLAHENDNHLPRICAGTSSKSTVAIWQKHLCTSIWTHAGLLYLCIVVSGWQPTSRQIRHLVLQITELLTKSPLPPALLLSMTWPLCVADCLAEPLQQDSLRHLLAAVQPIGICGTIRSALNIMETMWRSRFSADNP